MRSARIPAASLVCLLCASISAQSSWTPDKTLLSKLAPYVGVGGYKIRPPKGYAMEAHDGPDGSKAFAWTSTPRADGTRPMLMLATAPIPSNDKSTLDQVAKKLVGGIRARRTKFHEDAPQHGSIGGLKFVLIRWSGIAENGMKTRGFNYVAIDGSRLVELWSQDVLPGGEGALKLAEASILTCKK